MNPMGVKKLNRKTKNTDAYCADLSLFGMLLAIVRAVMQSDMPAPLNMKSLRRPKRSIVKKATKAERNFQVKQAPERIRAVSLLRLRLSWNIVVEYDEITARDQQMGHASDICSTHD